MQSAMLLLLLVMLLAGVPPLVLAKKDKDKVDEESLLPMDYMKVEDVYEWLKEKNIEGLDPEKFKQNNVQGTTLKWLGAMGRGDKQKEELLEKVGCADRDCYKRFSKEVSMEYVAQRNAKWQGKSLSKDSGEKKPSGTKKIRATPEEVKKFSVAQLQAFLQQRGIEPATVGTEKRDLRNRCIEIATQEAKEKSEKPETIKEEKKRKQDPPKKKVEKEEEEDDEEDEEDDEEDEE
eukprot:Sspe_Gene.55322::Locus_30430_Transcript_1_3_Confidence_0.429_Length_858::g.55322::m.55322